MGGITAATAPLRVSLAGGGTDASGYYARHGGLVVGFTLSARITVIGPQAGASGVAAGVGLRADKDRPTRHQVLNQDGSLRIPR